MLALRHSATLQPTACGRRHARRDSQQPRENMRQHATGDVQRATDDSQRSTRNVTRRDAGKATDSTHGMQQGTLGRCKMGQATDSAHHATWGTGAGNRKQTPCNVKRATCNKERARRHDPTVSNAADDHWKMDNRPSTTCNMHRGKCNRRHATCNGENALNDTQRVTDTI